MKHGLTKSKLFTVHRNMKQRCYNPNKKQYKNWGGRGIKVCDEWVDKENGFMNFYNWAMGNGYEENLDINGRNKYTLDRINVNGNYEPSNCRWVTMKEQGRNRSNSINNRLITYNGETHTISEWKKILGI